MTGKHRCPVRRPAADYSRDAAITGLFAALGQRVRIAHVPVWLVSAARTRYAADQLAHDVVLDLSRAAAQGWRPRRALPDYLAALR